MSKHNRARKVKNRENPNRMWTPIGLRGEVVLDSQIRFLVSNDLEEICKWADEGEKVSGSIPPERKPNAVPFVITGKWISTDGHPEWADVTVGETPIRINPEIAESPYTNLFSCLGFALSHEEEILSTQPGMNETLTTRYNGKEYCFGWGPIAGKKVIVIDTLDRIKKWELKEAVKTTTEKSFTVIEKK